jgi:hypothetical protein
MPMTKIGDWIAEFYYNCLWYLGFKDKDDNLTTPDDREKITFMLRRMQQRMKLAWAVLTLSTFMLLDGLMWAQHRWYLIPVYLFLAWLFWHILWPYKPPAEPLRFKTHTWYHVRKKK